LPTQPGALLTTLPVHSPNDLYDTTFRLFTPQSPFLMGKTQRAVALLSTERFVYLNANLHYFERRYHSILARRDERRDAMASVRGTPFRRIESLWYDYIRSQRAEIHSMLDRIAANAGGEPAGRTIDHVSYFDCASSAAWERDLLRHANSLSSSPSNGHHPDRPPLSWNPYAAAGRA
jgi:hypothetical protein